MHKISGIYLDTTLRKQYLGVFGYTALGSTVKNLKVTDSVYHVAGDTDVRYVGSIIGVGGGNLDTLYSDVEILCDGQDIGGIVGYMNFYEADKQQTINNLWFNGSISGDTGRRMGGIVGSIYGNEKNTPTYIFQNCLNSATISNTRVDSKDGLGGQYIGGILGQEANPTNIILKDCLSVGQINVEYATYVGSVMGRLSNKDSTLTIDGVYATQEVYKRYIHEAVGTQNGATIMLPESIITGVNGYKWTTLDFSKYWTAAKEDTPVLKSFSSTAKVQTTSVENEKRMVDIAWYNDSKKELTIDTLEELYAIVDNGGKVLDVQVEHAIYGVLSGEMVISSRFDANEFVRESAKSDAALLSDLTGGVHIHTVSVKDEETFARICAKLQELGVLIQD
jgi:hypothetical protein